MSTLRLALPSVAVIVLLPTLALAQQTNSLPKPRFHGFALGLHGVKTSTWTWDSCADCQAQPAGGIGLNVSYAFVPALAAYVERDWILKGEYLSDGWTTYEAGLEMRVPVHPLLMPYARAGLGHLSYGNGPSYTFSTFGFGIQFFPSRRLALHYGFQLGVPLGDGKVGGSSVPINDNYRRQFFGLILYLSARRLSAA